VWSAGFWGLLTGSGDLLQIRCTAWSDVPRPKSPVKTLPNSSLLYPHRVAPFD
jgi:hypothetical protein